MKRLTMTFGASLLALAAGAASAQNIRIGLQEDPDVLDPHRARTYVGRIVFTSLCDKLVDIDPKLHFVPQLATSWSFSDDNKVLTFKLRDDASFHDGTKFDAAAAKANLSGSFPLRLDSNAKLLANVAAIGFYGLPLDYLDQYRARIDAVTAAEVKAAFARHVRPADLVTITVAAE